MSLIQNRFLKHWKAAVAVVVIFACGALSGALGSAWFFKQKIQAFTDPAKAKRHHEMRINRMAEELELTPEQMEQIKPIIDAQMREARQLRQRTAHAMRAIRERGMAQMAPLLTQEQRQKLRQMNARRDERIQKNDGT
ncbi:hypothetical protein QPK87_15580 [Kamptonema cortianum]|nr:hypothetical protein [Kamptonema cortianum]